MKASVQFVERKIAKPTHAERERYGNTALFAGRSMYNRFSHIHVPGNTGMATCGGARGGKTRCCAIPALLSWGHSCWCIDVKGTLAAVTARYRREVLGQDVYVVDPFGLLGPETDGFDPLAIDPNAPDIRELINVRADAIVVPDPGTKDKFWDEGARTVIAGLLEHILHHERPSLPMIRTLLRQMPEDQELLWLEMAASDYAGGLAADAGVRVLRGKGTNEILGLLSTADRHSEWLSSAGAERVFSAPRQFSFAQLKEKPTTVYLVIPPHFLDIHQRLLRLFVNLGIGQMSIGGRSRVPVLGLVDEFIACGYMSEILKAFSLMQGYNLILWILFQDFKTAKALYGDRFNAIINNCRAVQMFAVSDEDSTRFASDRIGPRSLEHVVGMNSVRAVPLRNPSEVADEVNADEGLQYILRAGKAPLLLKKVSYNEDKSYKGPAFPDSIMRRAFPFWGKYDSDPDYA